MIIISVQVQEFFIMLTFHCNLLVGNEKHLNYHRKRGVKGPLKNHLPPTPMPGPKRYLSCKIFKTHNRSFD